MSKLITRNGFSVVSVHELSTTDIPENFTIKDYQYSNDKMSVYIKGNYTDSKNFDTYAELTDYIYKNGWSTEVVFDQDNIEKNRR